MVRKPVVSCNSKIKLTTPCNAHLDSDGSTLILQKSWDLKLISKRCAEMKGHQDRFSFMFTNTHVSDLLDTGNRIPGHSSKNESFMASLAGCVIEICCKKNDSLAAMSSKVVFAA